MSRVKCLGIAILAIGVLASVAGGFRMRTASGLRAGAGEFLRQQHDAQAAFQQDAAQVTKRYQAGEIDEAGWHRDTEAVSTLFKTKSEAAGTAWGNQLTSANRAQQHGLVFVVVGTVLLIAAAIVMGNAKGTAQPPDRAATP